MIEAIRNIFRYARLHIILSAVMSLLSGACGVLLLAMVGEGINSSNDVSAGYVARFGVMVLVTFAAAFVSQVLSAHLTVSFAMKMRIQICRAIVESPLRAIEEIGNHRLMAMLAQDAGSIAQAAMQVPQFCMNAGIVVCCLVYLGYVSLPVLVGVLLLVPFAVGSYLIPEKFAVRYVSLERENWDKLVEHFQMLTDGIKELKLNRTRRSLFFLDHLVPTSEAAQQHGQRGANIYIGLVNWSNLLCFVGIGVILGVLPRFTSVSHAALVSCALVLLYLRIPVLGLMDALREFNRASVALRKLKALGLPWEEAISKMTSTPAVQRHWHKIELIGVTHEYSSEADDRHFVLGPICMTLTPGRMVFITGGNGSGKTTLAKLITGLYAPEGGEVQLDGVAINEHNRDDYRQQFSAIFSDFALFEDLLGMDPERLGQQVNRYLISLRLDHKVRVLDGRLSTSQLSAGQRRRLALLHAYLEDRNIYLFDEWAADQDPEFKEIFYFSLLPDLRAKGKTVIVISHDDRYYKVADEVIRLENGKAAMLSNAQRPEPDHLCV